METTLATAPDRKYGLALRHAILGTDGFTVVPAWAVIVPMTTPLGAGVSTPTIPVYVLEAAYIHRDLVGQTVEVHTSVLSRAMGEVALGEPCCPARHRDNGQCCYPTPTAPAMTPPRPPFHKCAVTA